MTGQEFLRKLEQELTSFSYRQREEVMTYFKEYLAEIEDDPAAMAELGSPKELAKDLLAQLKEQDILETKLELATIEPDHGQFSHLVVALKTINLDVRGTYCDQLELELSDQLRERLEIVEEKGQLKIKEKTKPVFSWLSGVKVFNQQDQLLIKLPCSYPLESVKLSSLSGDIDLSQLQVDSLECQLTNGDLSLDYLQAKRIKLELTNGDLDLTNAQLERLSVELKNGDIAIDDSQWQEAHIESRNGDVEIDGVTCQQANLELLRGDLEVEGSIWQENFVADLSCGDAKVSLADNFKQTLSFDLATSFGDCSVKGHSSSGLSQQFTYQAAVVGPKLEIHNKFGDISLS